MLQKWGHKNYQNKRSVTMLLTHMSWLFFFQCATQRLSSDPQKIEEYVYRINFSKDLKKTITPSQHPLLFSLPTLPGIGISGIPDLQAKKKEDIQCQCMDYDASFSSKKIFLFSVLLDEKTPIKAFEPLLLERCHQVSVFLKNLNPSKKYQLNLVIYHEIASDKKLIIKEFKTNFFDMTSIAQEISLYF